MNQNVSKWIVFILGAFSFLVGASLFIYINGISFERIEDAIEIYRQGELAQSPQERRVAFNHSLNIYSEMEKEHNPAYGNGKLYYNIGNSYFQLNEYPMAILYYNKALNLRPNDSKVIHNLTFAEKKLGLYQPASKGGPERIFFFHHQYSLPKRLQLFSVIMALLFVVWSGCIWMKKRWLKGVLALLIVIAVCLLGSLLYSAYFTPLEGVLVKGSNLYRDAGKQYATVMDEVIPAGSKVEILEVKRDGRWYKILTPNKLMGYVPDERLRLIH